MTIQNIQAIRGMNDILPQESPSWQRLEGILRDIMAQYGYSEVRLPIMEKTELFARAIGEVTDIVEKEMYTFTDRNGDSLTLRPEGTAGCVRAVIENQMLRGQTPRLYYIGPMFRHERPQRGRYRQFHQIGVEAFGLPGPDVDAEIIAMTARILRRLGLDDVQLELNSLGSTAARLQYRERLVGFLQGRVATLCADCQTRLLRNPMRVLDCKVPGCQTATQGAPRLLDHLDAESAAHFDGLKARLQALNIPFVVNTTLVRGLDYYNRTVFEWTTTQLGAQGTVIAGGRYDGLVAQIGGVDTPAVGFAVGMERLLALCSMQAEAPPHIFLGALGDTAAARVLALAELLRDQGLSAVTGVAAGLKPLFKAAERSGAEYTAIVGESELAGQALQVKSQKGQAHFSATYDDLHARLAEQLQLQGRPKAPYYHPYD